MNKCIKNEEIIKGIPQSNRNTTEVWMRRKSDCKVCITWSRRWLHMRWRVTTMKKMQKVMMKSNVLVFVFSKRIIPCMHCIHCSSYFLEFNHYVVILVITYFRRCLYNTIKRELLPFFVLTSFFHLVSRYSSLNIKNQTSFIFRLVLCECFYYL
jgi:hypothetical protein